MVFRRKKHIARTGNKAFCYRCFFSWGKRYKIEIKSKTAITKSTAFSSASKDRHSHAVGSIRVIRAGGSFARDPRRRASVPSSRGRRSVCRRGHGAQWLSEGRMAKILSTHWGFQKSRNLKRDVEPQTSRKPQTTQNWGFLENGWFRPGFLLHVIQKGPSSQVQETNISGTSCLDSAVPAPVAKVA